MRGDGRIFQRGRVWWLSYYGADGKEIRESSGTDKESTARKLLRQRLQDVNNHRRGIRTFEGPQAQRLTVADLLDSLEASYGLRQIKSLKETRGHMKPIREFFGDYRALAVTTDLIRRYIEMQKSNGLANATINRQTQTLAAAFSLAYKEAKIATKPHIPHLRENNARQGFFESEELERIVRHLTSEPDDDIARYLYASGWRIGEVLPLRWEFVDRNAKEIRLPDSKNSRGRVLPLDDETWEIFERQWSRRKYSTANGATALSEFVFHVNGKARNYWTFKDHWDVARKAASLGDRVPHDFRRTCARNLVRAGVPESVAMGVTGHITASMFRRYSIVTTDDKREALRKQREYLKSQPSNLAEFPTARGTGE
jgi:integrase